MVTRTVRHLSAIGWTALAAIGSWGAAAYGQTAAQSPPAEFVSQEAVLKAMSVENLIGDAVSLSNQPYPDVEAAIQRFKNGDVEGAREYLETARKKYPKLPPTDLTLAKMSYIFRNLPAARAFLEKSVTDFPNDPEAYLLLGDFAFTEGRTTEAHALFEKAQAQTQKFAENPKRKQKFEIRVLAGLAAVSERRAQWPDANALLTKWVQLDPDSSAAHTRLGMSLFYLKKPAEALAEFRKARDLAPDSNHPNVLLGGLYTQAGDLAKAQQEYEKAYAEDKGSEATARSYAEWLIQQNNLDKAQQVAAAMRKASPDSVAALLLDGVVGKMRGQSKAAEEALVRVLTLDPGNASAINLLALILAESNGSADKEKALNYAKMNAERFANNPQANVTFAWVLYRMGRGTEANAVLQRSAQANLTPDSAYLVARILVQQNQRENAQRVLEQILKQAGAGMFLYKKEAEALLKELKGSAPASSPNASESATPPTATPAPGSTPAPDGSGAGTGSPSGTSGATLPGTNPTGSP